MTVFIIVNDNYYEGMLHLKLCTWSQTHMGRISKKSAKTGNNRLETHPGYQ